MSLEHLKIDPDDIPPEPMARAGALIRGGGLVAFPTETVYGLGCNAYDADAVARVFAAKGRPAHDPLIVHVADHRDLTGVVHASATAAVASLAERFWPGPLTIVAPKAANIPTSVTAGLGSVAVRCPAHPVALALLEAAQVPIAAPSANRFSYVSPTRADHVIADLGDACDMVIDSGPTEHGIESTVIRLEDSRVRVLRHGAIPLEILESFLGAEVLTGAAESQGTESGSPGMESRHYSPGAATFALRPSVSATLDFGLFADLAAEVRYLGYTDRPRTLPASWHFVPLGDSHDLTQVARDLYDNLRRNDQPGSGRILVVELTDEVGLGRALDDRLTRAAGGQLMSGGPELRTAIDQRRR